MWVFSKLQIYLKTRIKESDGDPGSDGGGEKTGDFGAPGEQVQAIKSRLLLTAQLTKLMVIIDLIFETIEIYWFLLNQGAFDTLWEVVKIMLLNSRCFWIDFAPK